MDRSQVSYEKPPIFFNFKRIVVTIPGKRILPPACRDFGDARDNIGINLPPPDRQLRVTGTAQVVVSEHLR